MDSHRDAAPPRLITLSPMPQRAEAQDSSEDWTGVTSTAHRKRLQNRLNQRAYRKRKQLRPVEQEEHGSDSSQQAATATGESPNEAAQSALYIEFEGHMLWPSSNRQEKTLNFARKAIQDFSAGITRPVILPTLVRLNVLNAITHNAKLLGFRLNGFCSDELISPFNQSGPGLPASTPEARYPIALRPTATQVAMVHHPWSDLIPIPGFRDNLLKAIELGFDEDLVCADLLRVDEQYSGRASLIVWGEPWDPRGWEASVAFLRKWGWLIKDCSDILDSTNYWRERRGEKKIRF
ncbi:hypothetical protein B0T10DRAFT_497666 [Thelonectria olida]|uniref:BZIP domain-containing protein n=1 Tax=Thelonectria olida TaxID=1576542 RepID=A0A9P9ALW5_9HYPO|nr:hypothetical protein B0T10DRAFT_497666 [Thelonectria olida]